MTALLLLSSFIAALQPLDFTITYHHHPFQPLLPLSPLLCSGVLEEASPTALTPYPEPTISFS